MPTTSRSPRISTTRCCTRRRGSSASPFQRDAEGRPVDIRRGQELLLTVARIEPLVEPSQIWVTERFKQALERAPSFYRAEPIDAHVRRELRAADGSFNVRKRGSAEADHHVALYRIVEPGLG